jgi:signal transduction histidine kinase/CheY-like chemotaxis protein
MVGALLKDWLVRLAVLVWLGGVVLYALYDADSSVVLDYAGLYSTPLMLIPIVLAAWLGLARLSEPHERRFWTVLGTGFAAWLAVSIPYAFISYAQWTFALDLTMEFGYLLYYVFFILAIELRPHELHTGSLAEKERQLRTVGLTVLAFFVLWYFVLVPANLAPETYATALPSFYMYVLLDLVIVGRLLWMRRETWSVRWSLLYAWLATAAGGVMVGDVLEAIGHAIPDAAIDAGHWPDHVWALPGILFVMAIRARHVPFPAEQSVLNEPAAGARTLRAGHVLLVGALLLPFLHYALYAAGAFSPGTGTSRSMREVVSMLSMISLGAFALAAYRTLEHEREQMEATEQRLTNELSVARKMDAVARLAGSIAHDFNNLVQVVRGRAEIIEQQIGDDSPLREEVRQIRAAAARAADLASQLMTFGRKQQTTLSSVSLHELLRRTAALLKPLLDDRRRLVLQLTATADVVRIDPLQFERIILNLATNARDAMPTGGTITIDTSSRTTRDLGLAAAAHRIVMRVSDTGTGMDAETISHIFEPFFTTKQERGAGLGLAIVHGLVQQFGGTISVESTPGRGTTFTITLPVVTDAPAPAGAPQIAGATDDVPGAILIVDGDTTNRQLMRRLLADMNAAVLATATAVEALMIAGRYTGRIDLAVIDVTIDGGRSLARRLRESRPDLKVLLLAQDQPLDLEPGDELLREPFELSDVRRKARELLA